MPAIKLILGPVTFRDFEVPTSINFGGKQMLAVHQLANGGRVIDSMGSVSADIAFTGAFSGPTAASRARLLNVMLNNGSSLSLTWDQFYYDVIIGRFEANYDSPLWIPYRIACTVLQNESSQGMTDSTSLESVVATDIDSAAVQCSSYGFDMSEVTADLQMPNATVLDSSDYQATSAAINNAQLRLQNYLVNAQSTLHSDQLFAAYSEQTTIPQFLDISYAAQQLALLVSANGYLGRAARNLASAST